MLDNLPTTKKQFAEKKEAIAEKLKEMFQKKTTGLDEAGSFMPEINKLFDRMMGKVEGQMKMKNAQETKSFIKKQFDSVERRLKAG